MLIPPIPTKYIREPAARNDKSCFIEDTCSAEFSLRSSFCVITILLSRNTTSPCARLASYCIIPNDSIFHTQFEIFVHNTQLFPKIFVLFVENDRSRCSQTTNWSTDRKSVV